MYTELRNYLGARIWHLPLEHVRNDAALHGYVAAYWAAGVSVGIAAGVQDKFAPLRYAVLGYFPAFSLAFVIGTGLWALWSRQPFARIRSALTFRSLPESVTCALLLFSLSVHMGVFTSVKTMLTDVTPFHADRALADFDEWLHGIAPWRLTTALLPPDSLSWVGPVYFGIWSLLLSGCLLACVFAPKLSHVRDQYLWTHLVLWPLLGNVVAGAAMSAGPVFYGLVTGDTGRFGELAAYVAHYDKLGELTQYLWQAYASGRPAEAAGISAFPSMHLANATMFALLAARIDRRLMWAAIAFCSVILFGSVHLGLHYAIDGYFSIVATVLVWWAVGWVLRSQSRRRACSRQSVISGSTLAGLSAGSGEECPAHVGHHALVQAPNDETVPST